jgi:small ligand-binding sensory domain FIST
MTMKWASAISENERLENAVKEVAASVRQQLGDAKPDFAAVFVSQAFAERYEEIPALLGARLSTKLLVGASAGGVIGDGQEVEQKPGISLVAAVLPDVRMTAFSIQDEDLPDLDDSPHAWENLVGVKAGEAPQFLIIVDPFSIRADNFLMGLDFAFPKAAKVGGLASGGSEPGKNALYLNNLCVRSVLVGVAFMGDIQLETVVAQGCKPVGEPLRITDANRNVLMGVNGHTPLEELQKIVENISDHDRDLMRHSLFLGLAMDPHKENPGAGDFLIRNIIGVDNDRGFLAIASLLRVGQTVRFHVRDAKTSGEDLKQLLDRLGKGKTDTRGAMMFSCVGRGQTLYGRANHDSRLFRQTLGPVPLGGFFCNGEIGPVGGITYLHGYTSCFGLFRPK